MKKSQISVSVLAVFSSLSFANDRQLETVVVTGSKPVESYQSTHAISALKGKAFTRSVGGSVGETIKNMPGVDSASFGSGVGLPVIRGQGGNRVRVLNNGIGVLDASSVSPDHGNSIDTFVAEGVEVIRGPATLLYGNGASGGVVNVIDRRVPQELLDQTEAAFEFRHNTNNDQNTALVKMDGSAGYLAWHFDASKHDSNDTRIPGEAIIHDEHNHDPDEFNTDGYVGNSDLSGENISLGSSLVFGESFLGFSYSRFESNYGLPEGSHSDHDTHSAPAMPGEEEAVAVRIDMQQEKLDIKGKLVVDAFVNKGVSSIEGQLAIVDYEHRELEEEEEDHGHTGDEHSPTVFSSEGFEGKLFVRHSFHDNHSGNVGIHISENDFSVKGEESYLDKSDKTNLAFFIMESWEFAVVDVELGFRVEEQDIDYRACDSLDATRSFSGAFLFPLSEDKRNNILLGMTHSNRAPTVEEYYSNIDSSTCRPFIEPVLHTATSQIEIGNPSLKIENANNIELAWRYSSGNIRNEINVFYNDINKYIYLEEIGETADGEEIAAYLQQDASFSGVEISSEISLTEHYKLGLFTDYVRAKLDDGGNVPRIPPLSFGFSLRYEQQAWLAQLRAEHALEQKNVAEHESKSPAYTDLSFYLEYQVKTKTMEENQSLVLFGKVNNLLDEEIRNPVSFLKNYAPEPGVGVEVGLRMAF